MDSVQHCAVQYDIVWCDLLILKIKSFIVSVQRELNSSRQKKKTLKASGASENCFDVQDEPIFNLPLFLTPTIEVCLQEDERITDM